jgi:hypothetical protein
MIILNEVNIVQKVPVWIVHGSSNKRAASLNSARLCNGGAVSFPGGRNRVFKYYLNDLRASEEDLLISVNYSCQTHEPLAVTPDLYQLN